jgi:hypothetical protein
MPIARRHPRIDREALADERLLDAMRRGTSSTVTCRRVGREGNRGWRCQLRYGLYERNG